MFRDIVRNNILLFTLVCVFYPVQLSSDILIFAQNSLPNAKEIVERYDKALGGKKAILKHTSCTMSGELEVYKPTGAVKLSFIFYTYAPFKRLEKISLPDNKGNIINCFDGTIAWSFDPRSGAQVYSGDDRESMKRDADFYYSIDELLWFKSMETIGIENFEGHQCYHLHGINNWNKANDHFYDQKTGLLTGYEFNSLLGLTHEIFADYKKIDGILFPTKQILKVKSKEGKWAIRQVFHFKSVVFNNVDSKVFKMPEVVSDLLTKKKK